MSINALSSQVGRGSWKKLAIVMTLVTIVGEIALILYWSLTFYWSSNMLIPLFHLFFPSLIEVLALVLLFLWLRYSSLATTPKEKENKNAVNNSGDPLFPHKGMNDTNAVPQTQVSAHNRNPHDASILLATPVSYGNASGTTIPAPAQVLTSIGEATNNAFHARPETPPQEDPGANQSPPAQAMVIQEPTYSPAEVRYFIFPKEEGNDPRYCADKCSMHNGNRRFAVTDGVSRSFLSPEWADIIATNYTHHPNDFRTKEEFIAWLTICSQDWEQWARGWILDAEKKGIYESWDEKIYEGAETTFVGCSIFLQPDDYYTVHVHAVGDANFFHLSTAQRDFRTYHAFPNTIPRTHQSATDTLSTPSRRFQRTYDLLKKEKFAAQRGDYLFLVTDALMNWILTPPEAAGNHLDKLLQIDRESKFRSFVMSERGERRLEEDDTTMLIIPL